VIFSRRTRSARGDLRSAIEGAVSRAVALFCTCLFVVVVAMQARNTWLSTVAELERQARYLAGDLEDHLNHWQRALGMAVGDLERLGCGVDDWDCGGIALQRLVASETEFVTAIRTDAEGRVTAAAVAEGLPLAPPEALRGSSVADREYFREPQRSGLPFTSGLIAGRGFGDDRILALSRPLFAADGSFRGVIEVSVSETSVAGWAEALLARMGGAQSAVAIDDPYGRRLFTRQLGSGERGAADVGTITDHIWHPYVRHHASQGFVVSVAASGTAVLLALSEVAIVVLVSALALLYFLRRTVHGLAVRLAEPLERLAAKAGSTAVGDASNLDISLLPEDAWKEARDIQNALLRLLARTRKAVDEARLASQSLAHSNAELAVALDERDGYIDRQTQRLQHALGQARQSAEARARLIANTSHEIRTPLNGILGTTELLLRSEPLTPTQGKLLRVQLSAARGLLTLVNDILDLSRIGREMLLDSKPFDVRQEALLVCDALRPLASEKGLFVSLRVEGEFHGYRRGDPARFRQILMGLLGNAIKFTMHGGVTLVLQESETYELCVSVQDTGSGIPAAKFDAIFEPYVQLDATTSRRYGGAGLGLAIVRDVVQAMNGRITVESEVGRGSTFRVTLPLDLAQAEEVRADDEEIVPDVSALHVLIVDDIEMNRDLLELQLATFGCRSTKAGGGHEALACLESAEFDLVLLDCQMPEMDGYEVARAARARWPARSLHIIAVTAHAQSDERARCLEAGMDDYVSKPLAMATLARVLREAHALALQSPRDRASG
jgi:signal transduction histidine kinase/ActR/RegA family two-component response regulator